MDKDKAIDHINESSKLDKKKKKKKKKKRIQAQLSGEDDPLGIVQEAQI